MNRKNNAKNISRILDEISRMQNSLYALNVTDPQKYPENYAVLSMDIALKSEEITCKLRNIVFENGIIGKDEYFKKASNKLDISIREIDDVIKITLPLLLPKKQANQGKFLIDPLYSAFNNYVISHDTCIYDECVIYIVNMYDKAQPRKFHRDYDNNEVKQLIDAIAAYFLIDDSGNFVDVHNTTELGMAECTQVYLIRKAVFPAWLESHLSRVETMSQNG